MSPQETEPEGRPPQGGGGGWEWGTGGWPAGMQYSHMPVGAAPPLPASAGESEPLLTESISLNLHPSN